MITQAINKPLLVAYKATLAQINLILQMTIQLNNGNRILPINKI